MEVTLYDGRTNTRRTMDVPYPLLDEITVSKWEKGVRRFQCGRWITERCGVWRHEVYARSAPGTTAYHFIGTAPSRPAHSRGDGNYVGFPRFATTPWPRPLYGERELHGPPR
jgi:hypothetical protein